MLILPFPISGNDGGSVRERVCIGNMYTCLGFVGTREDDFLEVGDGSDSFLLLIVGLENCLLS
jgi:hypothetical protein